MQHIAIMSLCCKVISSFVIFAVLLIFAVFFLFGTFLAFSFAETARFSIGSAIDRYMNGQICLENCVMNENCVCMLFARNAQCNLDKIFASYGDDIVSSCHLRSFVTDIFLNDIITDDIIVLISTSLSFSFSFMLLALGKIKMNLIYAISALKLSIHPVLKTIGRHIGIYSRFRF